MQSRTHGIAAHDGLALHVREWGGGPGTPLLCLPGLVRTADDFEDLAALHAGARRVVSLDYAGRGRSGRSPDLARYRPEPVLRDVLDACAAVHLHRAVIVGTSFGGLLAMGIAALRPGLVAGVVLNDIGPEIGPAGEAFIRRFVADDPALPDLAAAAAHLRILLPHLALTTEEEWRHFAAITYAPGPDGRWHPRWDTRIAATLVGPVRDLWPLFGALDPFPVLLLHGARSALLLADTVARMRARRPDMAVATVQEAGHAPTLAEPEARAALAAFLPP